MHPVSAGYHVFVSATSTDLKSYRQAVRDTLLSMGGIEPHMQDHLRPDYREVKAILEEEIGHCQAVICLVGFVYGREPANRPEGLPRRSYTQMEYDIAVALGKPVYLFFAGEDCPFDNPAKEPKELRDLQLAYREELRTRTAQVRMPFSSVDNLAKQVALIKFPRLPPEHRPQNLPYDSLGTLFKGRENFLEQLRDKLEGRSGRAAAIVAKQAIHGLGGVGKTRLAVEYAWMHRDKYTALLYVFADTPENLRRNLALLTGPLVLNLAERDEREEEVKVAAALRWLEQHPGWFLILDNVDSDEAAGEVERLLARLQGGHVVITSRLALWRGGVEPLELDVLGEQAAVAFLLERTAQDRRMMPTDEADAGELARDLDGLALALEQAGAYVIKKRCSLADYLQRWRQQDARVRGWFDERLMKYPRSVATTWETTLAQLEAPAQALLRLLAWLAPEPVPGTFLRGDAVEKLFGEVCAGAPPGGGSAGDLEEAVAGLADYSLLKREAEDGREAFRVHRLVAEVTRGRLGEEERRYWLQGALRLVKALAPGRAWDVATWPVWEPLRPHAVAVIAHAEEAGITEPTGRLMNDLGLLLKAKAFYDEAEPLYRRALAIDEKAYGPDHPTVAADLNNLAVLLQGTNRLGKAEPLYRRALAIKEKAYGPDHPTVATGLNNLALLLKATNRLGEAEPLYRRALAITEQAYGPDHPTVAAGLNNLALLLKATNRLGEAEPLYRRALAITEQAYGPEHPTVATGLNNLAGLLQDTNRLGEAEPLYRRALAITEQAYGPDHPTVAIRLNNLALLLQDTNRLGEAELLYRRALAIDEKAYGPDHPTVAIRLNNLALLLQDTNRLEEAEPLFRRVVAILGRFSAATGHQHPNLKATVANYRRLLEMLGLDENAIDQKVQEALTKRP